MATLQEFLTEIGHSAQSEPDSVIRIRTSRRGNNIYQVVVYCMGEYLEWEIVTNAQDVVLSNKYLGHEDQEYHDNPNHEDDYDAYWNF